jgi:hypothetical protein
VSVRPHADYSLIDGQGTSIRGVTVQSVALHRQHHHVEQTAIMVFVKALRAAIPINNINASVISACSRAAHAAVLYILQCCDNHCMRYSTLLMEFRFYSQRVGLCSIKSTMH